MGRHAAAADVDDEALASEPSRPGAHRAEVGSLDAPAARKATRKAPATAAAKTTASKTTAAKPVAKATAPRPRKKDGT